MPDNGTQAKLGWYSDGLPDDLSPERPVMLQCSDDDILVTCIVKPDEPLLPYFQADIRRPRPILDPPTPTTGVFYGDGGPVALAGGRYLAGSFGATATYGRIRFRFAVHGGTNLKYDRINGLRTRIQGMAEWFNLSLPEWDLVRTPAGTVHGVQVTARSKADVVVADRLGLSLELGFQSEPVEHGTLVTGLPSLKTRGEDDAPWEDHLKVHRLVADLLAVAAGEEVAFEAAWAIRDDDPAVAIAGNELGPVWCRATVPSLHLRVPTDRLNFLFTSADLAGDAVSRWLALDESHFHRALDHVRGTFRSRFDYVESRFGLIAMAVEHLGHAIGVEQEKWPGSSQASYRDKATCLADSLPGFVRADWPARMAQLNRALKHADHGEPDPTELIDATRETQLVLRSWVAIRLGMSPTDLLARLREQREWRVLVEPTGSA